MDVVRLSTLHQNTPTLTVINNTGLMLRQLRYYRREAENATALRTNLQTYDTAGYLQHSIDARLSEAYLKNPASITPNQIQINTLSGTVLQSKNVDAGMRLSISDVRGLSLWTSDSLGNERSVEYDKLGRVTSVQEKVQGKKAVCCERFVYGDKTAKENNGIGRLLKHYDPAGLREIKNYGVQAKLLQESRQFLANTTDLDWPEDLSESQKLLETERYTTQWQYNGLGETLNQTDAKDNKQRTVYGVAGELVSTSLQLAGATEQAVITKQTYSAAAQLLEKHLANGVVINYGYEEKTQCLSRLHSVRLSDSKSLQDLNYVYDPVGNILEILDKAQEPAFYANEKTEAISQYRYDSLYQLIEASGRESQQAAGESVARDTPLHLGNADASRCVNYTRGLMTRGVAMLMKNFGHPVPKIHSPNATEISCDSSGVRHALAHSGRRAVASTMTLRRDAFPASPVNARLSQALQLRIASAMLSLSHRTMPEAICTKYNIAVHKAIRKT